MGWAGLFWHSFENSFFSFSLFSYLWYLNLKKKHWLSITKNGPIFKAALVTSKFYISSNFLYLKNFNLWLSNQIRFNSRFSRDFALFSSGWNRKKILSNSLGRFHMTSQSKSEIYKWPSLWNQLLAQILEFLLIINASRFLAYTCEVNRLILNILGQTRSWIVTWLHLLIQNAYYRFLCWLLDENEKNDWQQESLTPFTFLSIVFESFASLKSWK